MEQPAAPAVAQSTRGLPVWIFAFVGLAVMAAAPLAVYPVLLMNMMCFGLFAAAFNLLIGYVGLLSFGHAAFFGTGAYLAAVTAQSFLLPPELALLAAAASGGALGLAVGFVAIRRKGIYFSMITLALARMVQFAAQQLPFTHGEDGLHGVPRGRLFGLLDLDAQWAMYAFVLVTFALGLAIIWRIIHSPFGSILKSIRENETRAVSLGYDVDRYKLMAFTISAALAGAAGGLKALVFQGAALTDVAWQSSGEVILMTLLGGIGTFLGPVVGAFFVKGLEDQLASSGFPIPVLIGSVFIVCVLLFRRGVIGEIEARLRRRWERKSAAA